MMQRKTIFFTFFGFILPPIKVARRFDKHFYWHNFFFLPERQDLVRADEISEFFHEWLFRLCIFFLLFIPSDWSSSFLAWAFVPLTISFLTLCPHLRVERTLGWKTFFVPTLSPPKIRPTKKLRNFPVGPFTSFPFHFALSQERPS